MVGAGGGGGPEAKKQMATCCKGRCIGIRILLSGVQGQETWGLLESGRKRMRCIYQS